MPDTQVGRVATPPGPAVRRRPTLQDVADRAGVSRALVSIVVRNAPGASAATRARVLEVAAEIGYRPDVHARFLARQRSRLLGVTVQLGHPFHADVVAGLYSAVERHGYELVLSATVPGRDLSRAADTLLDYRAEGLVLLSPDAGAAALAAIGARVPVVVVARRVAGPAGHRGVDVVRTADDVGVGQAVDHLVGLGHRRIAHVDGGSAAGAAGRLAGYRAAVRRHRLPRQVVPGGQSEEDGARAARALIGSGLPSAVVCYNDRSAIGLLDVLIRSGVRVPEDVSVVGFDDSQLARLSHINLTTVAQDVDRMAQLAVDRLVTRLEPAVELPGTARPGHGDGPPGEIPDVPHAADGPTEVVLPPRLVVRGSTGPPALGRPLGPEALGPEAVAGGDR